MGLKSTLRAVGLGLMLAMGSLVTSAPATAQNLFETVATVNGEGINRFQVEQRLRFLQLLRAPDLSFERVRDVLVDETLQLQAARAAGIEVTPEQLDGGMVEFAARGNLEPEQLLQLLERAGIAPETFRDFVRNGLYWRGLVQNRFGAVARPSDAEIERAIAQGDTTAGIRVLLSEIALPLTPETQAETLALAQRLSDTLRGQTAFQQAARRYSRSASAGRGGRLDYVPLSQLAPPIAAQVLALSPGEVTDPINLGSFVGIYLLRDLQEGTASGPSALSVDYAQVILAGGRTDANLARAATLRRDTDTCDDLYGVADGLPIDRQVRAVADLPEDLRQTFAGLDDNEATTLGGAEGLRFVMLCGRVTEIPEGAYEQVGGQLLNQRLGSYASNYLEELRADAIISGF